MHVAVIIQRIQAAVERGDLPALLDTKPFAPLNTMGDLLRPWGECFPGVEPPEEDEGQDFLGNRRSMSQIRKPKFMPQPRRSPRPLPAPRQAIAAPKLVHPGLFQSVAGVWEYYETKGEDKPELLHMPFDFDGMHKFLDPLWQALSDYYPLGCDIENIGSDGPVNELHGLTMRLPFFSYDDPGVGVVEGFLSGAGGVESLMHHFSKSFEWDLPKQDKKLLSTVSWGELAATYRDAPGEKSYHLQRLENVEESYFADVKKRFPAQYGEGFDIITDDWGSEITIKSAQDIVFAIACGEAFDNLCGGLPEWAEFENDPDVSAEFAHELCNVWRRVNGKKQVKWAPSGYAKRIQK